MNRRGKTKEGFLYVKQPSRFGKAWKRKWVVIRPNTTKGSEQSSVLLELYLEKGAYNKTVTSLLLEGITQIKRVISKSQPRAFEFVKDSTVSLTLAGDSETETQEWIEIFKKLLLPASEQKELTAIQGYGKDVIRVSIVPNKDSERLKLSGTYLAGVSRLQVTLHNVLTGEKAIEWDLRHMKRFMLPSKGPQQDLEKIACIQISNRSPQGEGEYLFHSPNAKPLVEAIYERLSSAITVKERRSRTSSMLFEIPPKELEQLAKAIQDGGDPGFVMVNADGSLEDETFESEGEKKENGEAIANGGAEVNTNGDSKESHVDNSSTEEAKLENGESDVGKLENGQSEEVNTDAETPSQETKEDETPVGGGTIEAAQENGLSANGDHESPKVAANDTPVENNEDVTADSIAVSQESADTVAEEVAQSEKTGDELNENSDDAKDNGNTQPEPESSPANDASAEDSSNTAPVETQDFAAGPIDAEDETEELVEDTAEVQPRMPPGSEEPDEHEASEKTAPNDASGDIDERTVGTVDSVVSAEKNSEEVAEVPQTQSLTEDSSQVEISTDTQDIETESTTIDGSSALSEQSVTTSENDQQEVVHTEEPKGSEPSEQSSTESPQQVDESTAEAAVTPESPKTESADAGETPALQETSTPENESQEQNEKVSDEGNSPTEQTQDGPTQQVDDAPDNTTSTSDEEAQDAKPLVVETVESIVVKETVVIDAQETNEEPVGENTADDEEAQDAKPLVVETVESIVVKETVVIDAQETNEEPVGENTADEDTAM